MGVSDPSFPLRFSNRIRGVPPEKTRHIRVMRKTYQPHLSHAEGQNVWNFASRQVHGQPYVSLCPHFIRSITLVSVSKQSSPSNAISIRKDRLVHVLPTAASLIRGRITVATLLRRGVVPSLTRTHTWVAMHRGLYVSARLAQQVHRYHRHRTIRNVLDPHLQVFELLLSCFLSTC